jgi:glucose/arabinose dehydrogenase/azurin
MMREKRWRLAALAIGLAMIADVPGERMAAAGFELRPKDHICIIGNTLAERMQYDGWLEATIQARFPKHELVFRNLGFSGDEIATRLRSKNFGTPDEWLSGLAEPIGGYEDNRFAGTNTRADVVFAFFGYNESYAGEAGLSAFKKQLADWIAHTLSQKYNGRSAPRVVLFSPIAHEDLGNPDLPNGKENNVRLALYTKAMAEVTASGGVTFVDLFTPSARLYEEHKAPLTIQGIHLNSDGNREIARVIDRELFGNPPTVPEALMTRLREAVIDKDLHWFHRYRVTDGYSTYGDRAFLTFVRGTPRNVNPNQAASTPKEDVLPSNYDVLQRELPILDMMTAKRDRRIWAVAAGSDFTVDDSDTLPFVDAKTNLPRAAPFLGEAESIAAMKIAQGLKVELFASEKEFPELVKPVQMAFDPKGRLWVAAWKNYPHWQPKTPRDDKLLILEDTNGDGKADKRTVFAGDLENPTGFEFYNGGVLLAQQPNVVFLKDTDGDDRYDTKQIVLHGFDSADTHHAINSFTFDPGGGLYMQEGIFHRTGVETPWGPVTRQVDGGVYRFEPRTWKFETYIPFNFPNPHGHVFDYWGRNIVFDATGGQPYYGPSFSTKKYFPAMETRQAPKPGDVRTRPVGGAEILSSRHFPEAMQGNLIVLNTIGFRGLLNYKISEDGAGLKIAEVDPVLQSADENFRPVDAEVGPDGALYFVDWHNPIIGHMQHNLRDTSRDRLHGRVYRVTAVGRPLLKPPQIAGAPLPQLLDLLKEPEDRVRYRARIELGARETKDVLAAVQTWIDRLDPKDPKHEHHLMEALWVHQWHNRVNEKLLGRMLRSSDPWARAAATRVLCYWRDRVPNALPLLKVQATDEHPGVRLEAVRAASFFQTPEAAAVAVASLERPQDRFLKYTLDQAMNTLKAFGGSSLTLDLPARALEYQLGRLSDEELVVADRKDDDPKYRPVYFALLTRKGVAPQFRDEAIAALVKIDKSTASRVLLEALAKVPADDPLAAGKLLGLLFSQPPATLRQQRDSFAQTIERAREPLVVRGAYGALMIADAKPDAAWQMSLTRDGHLVELLRTVPSLPSTGATGSLGAQLFPSIVGLLDQSKDPAIRRAAVSALGWTRRDAATFDRLAREHISAADDETRAAAIGSLQVIPEAVWPAGGIEPLARSILTAVGAVPANRRTEPAVLDAIQFGDRLAAKLPDPTGRSLRRDLRALGVQVVRIETIPEKLSFDLKWFAVEAGKPVQIVLVNPDAMPHNLIVGRPGSLQEIGTDGGAMPMPTDPTVKPFVPDSPLVLQATRLLQEGETDRLGFLAPRQPGEYVYVCTFPGHWIRMYGVMLVVEKLEEWEASPTVPIDPMTKQPFASQRH